MGELRDLIGIYGAIDRQVAEDAERARSGVAAAAALPGRRRAVVRRLRRLDAGAAPGRPPEVPPFPSLEEALRDLADIEPEGRMRARRLWVIALAAQAFPELLRRRTAS